MILVSIIIPAYNTACLIERCLKSVANQTYSNLEIIVINDASTDNTLEVTNKFAENDNRIKILDFKTNKGNGYGRNTAVKYAHGEYVYFVDSDDYIELNAIEILIDKAITKQADIVVLGHKQHYKSSVLGRKRTESFLPQILGNETKEELCRHFLLQTKGFQMPPWKYFSKKDFLLENKIFFDESGVYFEDVIFATKLVFGASNIVSVSKELYNYVIRKNSIMGSYSRKSIEDKFKVLMTVREFLKQQKAFELFKEEYSMFFLVEGILASCMQYAKMPKKDKEIEQFLFEISQSSFVQEFDVKLIKVYTIKNGNSVLHIQNMIKNIQKKFYSFITFQRFIEKAKRNLRFGF